MKQRRKFFAFMPCFFPEVADEFVERPVTAVKKSASQVHDAEIGEGYIKSTQTQGGASTSSSMDEPEPVGKSSPKSVNEIGKAKSPIESNDVREAYKKSKKSNSDVTNAVSAELLEPEQKQPPRGLSCHPVLTEWDQAISIASDEEEGEGRLSDYEC